MASSRAMEELHVHEYDEPDDSSPSTNGTGPRSSKLKSRSDGAVVLSLGLLSVFLLARLISFFVYYRASEDKLSSVSEERDLLNASLTHLTQEMDRRQRLSKQNRASEDKLSSVSEERDLLNASLTHLTQEMDRRQRWTNNRTQEMDRRQRLTNNLTQEMDRCQRLSKQNRASEDKLSSVSEERDLLNASLTHLTQEMDRRQRLTNNLTQEMDRRQRLSKQNRASEDKLSSVSEERDLLNASLTHLTQEMDRRQRLTNNLIQEMDRLQRLSKQKKTCPEGWRRFSCSCYLLSTRSGSWEESRKDCRDKGADLVIIDSLQEQEFLSSIITHRSWIGLNDRDDEGTWKWVDGTPLTKAYWILGEPSNSGGKEDCAEIMVGRNAEINWNDYPCHYSLKWICENLA